MFDMQRIGQTNTPSVSEDFLLTQMLGWAPRDPAEKAAQMLVMHHDVDSIRTLAIFL